MASTPKDPKMVLAGRKASATKGFKVEQEAAWKAIDTAQGIEARNNQDPEEDIHLYSLSPVVGNADEVCEAPRAGVSGL